VQHVTHSPRIAAGIEHVLARASALTAREGRRLGSAWRKGLRQLEPHRLRLELALTEADVDGVWTDVDIDRVDMAFSAVSLTVARLPLREKDRSAVIHAVSGVVIATLTLGLSPLYVSTDTRIELARPWLAAVGPLPAELF
jgi:hypothetical protein